MHQRSTHDKEAMVTTQSRPDVKSTASLHILLLVQSVIIILLTINRLSSLTVGYVAPNQFLRWVDLNNMLFLPLVSVLAFYLLKNTVATDGPARRSLSYRLLDLTLIAGIYLLGAGYGDHEITNYLHIRFCSEDPASDLCRIIIFNDDEFSHWVFFAGFVLINASLMLLQALFPWRGPVGVRDNLGFVVNGLFIGLGLFANLAFERIGIDLYVVALLAALAVYLLWRVGRQPLIVYYATAYTFGLLSTAIVKIMSG
jgi:hypothetical protein